MNFNNSKDGIQRATVRVEYRLTRDEVALIKAYFKMSKNPRPWRDFLYIYGAHWLDKVWTPAEAAGEQDDANYIELFQRVWKAKWGDAWQPEDDE